MYFIPRNNAIYNYLAHTNTKRRYCATLFAFVTCMIGGYYGIYKPLISYILISKTELTRLQRQYRENIDIEKGNAHLSILIHTHKKYVADHVITEDKEEKACNKHRQYIFDLLEKLNIKLSSYGPCKETDNKWYTKESAPYSLTGSIENLLSFLKTIKESNQMIIVSHLNVTQLENNLFQLKGDIGFITVKK